MFGTWKKNGQNKWAQGDIKKHLGKNKKGSMTEVGRSLGVEVFLAGSTAAVSRYGLGWVSSSAFSSQLDGWRDGAGSRLVEARR